MIKYPHVLSPEIYWPHAYNDIKFSDFKHCSYLAWTTYVEYIDKNFLYGYGHVGISCRNIKPPVLFQSWG